MFNNPFASMLKPNGGLLMLKTRLVRLMPVIIGILVIGPLHQCHNKAVNTPLLAPFDTMHLTSIIVTPQGASTQQKLIKSEQTWYIEAAGQRQSTDARLVADLITQVSHLTATRIMTDNPNKWAEYEVSDSGACRVQFMAQNKEVAHIVIGKFSFNQQSRTMTSYIRLNGKPEVYAVENFLSVMIGRNVDAFRNRMVINGPWQQWHKLSFYYPNDSGFVLTKVQNQWLINGQEEADSAKMATFLFAIENLSEFQFSEHQIPASEIPQYKCVVEGNNETYVSVNAYKGSDGQFLITSSVNEGNTFISNQTMEKLFVSVQSLTK